MKADILLTLNNEQLLTLAHLAYNYGTKFVHIDAKNRVVHVLTSNYNRVRSNILLNGREAKGHVHKCKHFEHTLENFYTRLRSNLRRRLVTKDYNGDPIPNRRAIIDDILRGKYSYMDVIDFAPQHKVAPQYVALQKQRHKQAVNESKLISGAVDTLYFCGTKQVLEKAKEKHIHYSCSIPYTALRGEVRYMQNRVAGKCARITVKMVFEGTKLTWLEILDYDDSHLSANKQTKTETTKHYFYSLGLKDTVEACVDKALGHYGLSLKQIKIDSI